MEEKDQVVESTQTDSVEETTQKNERDWKKEYYKEYGTRKQLETKVSQIESKVNSLGSSSNQIDYGDYNKEQVDFMSKLAETKAEQIVEKRLSSMLQEKHNQELVSKEEQAFLDKNPEAIEYIDKVKELQWKYFQWKSYNYVYKKFFSDEEKDEPAKGVKLSWWTWWADVSNVQIKDKKVTDDDLRKHYAKQLGR